MTMNALTAMGTCRRHAFVGTVFMIGHHRILLLLCCKNSMEDGGASRNGATSCHIRMARAHKSDVSASEVEGAR